MGKYRFSEATESPHLAGQETKRFVSVFRVEGTGTMPYSEYGQPW